MKLDVEPEHRPAGAVENPVVGLGVTATLVLEFQFLRTKSLPIEALECALGETSQEKLAETLPSLGEQRLICCGRQGGLEDG